VTNYSVIISPVAATAPLLCGAGSDAAVERCDHGSAPPPRRRPVMHAPSPGVLTGPGDQWPGDAETADRGASPADVVERSHRTLGLVGSAVGRAIDVAKRCRLTSTVRA